MRVHEPNVRGLFTGPRAVSRGLAAALLVATIMFAPGVQAASPGDTGRRLQEAPAAVDSARTFLARKDEAGAKKRLKELASGDTLVVLATDPSAVKDFDAFCALTGHALVASEAEGGIFRFTIRKA